MISIIIPTCFRPQLFSQMLDSLVETTQGYELEIIAVIDKDEQTREMAENRGLFVDFKNEMRGALACWNIGLAWSSGDIIVPSGDDQKFYPNWLDFALESHRGRLGGYGVIGMNDLAYDGNTQIATTLMFDRQFCKDHLGGVIAPPVYNYYCVDSEINEKSKSMNRFYWDDRAIVEHLHSAHGKREFDEHDKQRLDNNFAEQDNRTFSQRKLDGFPITWEGVI